MITRIIELSCDHVGCDVAYAPSVMELTSLRLTRIGSAVIGWTRSEGLDFCPDHPREDRAAAVQPAPPVVQPDTQDGPR